MTVVLMIMTSVMGAGCTQSKAPPNTQATTLIHYNVNQITELTLGKFDPETGEHWMTTLKRINTATKKRITHANWEITSLPDGNNIQDRKANATFIMHLLDSLQGLRKTGDAPNGALDSLGLDPPRFVIRVKTDTGTQELRIGGMSDDKLGNYLAMNPSADQKSNSGKIIIASGSALKMLSMISSFEYLRDHSWTPFSADDIDEIALSDQGKPYFYAQREGSQWNDKNHHPLKDPEPLLRVLTEIQPKGLIDDPTQVARALKLSSSQPPTYEAKLIDRRGTPVILKLLKTYGLSSTRPSTLFVFSPEILTTFRDSKQSYVKDHK